MDQLPCNSHVDDDDDHGWTKVVSRKKKGSGRNERRILTENKTVSADVKEILRAETAKNPQPKNKKKKKKKKEETVRAETPNNPQPKKDEKKPIMSLSEAMAKIDHSSLAAFLAVSLESYSDEPVTQLLRFMNYIGRELTEVQFPWLEMFPFEGTWPKVIDVMNVPLCDIPEPISNTSVSWILQLPVMQLSGFVVWAFGCTITHLEAQQKGAKSGKIGEQPTSPKPHMPIFVTLAMVVHWRPEALTYALATIRGRRYFQGQDRLPLTVWMMAVVRVFLYVNFGPRECRNLCVFCDLLYYEIHLNCKTVVDNLGAALFSWAHNLLPVVGNTSCNPQSTDLILQLVEEIVADPEAWTMRRNQAGIVHQRMIPPPSFEILLRLTFPASSARVKATERFEAVYPSLKEVALTGEPGNKAMQEVIQQIFSLSLKLAGEGNPALAKEATAIAIWCVTENVDCCKHWDSLYTKNIEASVALLNKLVDEWKDHSLKLFSSARKIFTVTETMKSFRLKNEEAITEGGANASLYKEADKSCKFISRRISHVWFRHYCFKALAVVLAVAAGLATAAAVAAAGVATFIAIVLFIYPELRDLLW